MKRLLGWGLSLFFCATVTITVEITALEHATHVSIFNTIPGLTLSVEQTEPTKKDLLVGAKAKVAVARIERPLPLLGKKGAPYTWRGALVFPGDLRVHVAVVYKNGQLFYSISEGTEKLIRCSDLPVQVYDSKEGVIGFQAANFPTRYVQLQVTLDPANMLYQQLTFVVSVEDPHYRFHGA